MKKEEKTLIKGWLEGARKEHAKAIKSDNWYDVEYWDGKVQAFEDVLAIIK